MANNYLQFSTAITKLTEKEIEWCKKRLEELRHTPGDSGPGEDEELDFKNPDADNYYELQRHESCADFDYHFQKDEGDDVLWFNGESGGNVEDVGEFIREFLSDNRPGECAWFEWAETCDRPRIGEFGGGAVFITSDSLEFLSTSHWARDLEKRFMERKKG